MKNPPNRNRRAALLLIAAAALPFTPLLAQDTQPVPPAQPTDTVPPPAAPAPAPVDTTPAPAPVVVAPPPVATAPPPAAAAPPLAVSTAPASTPARRAATARAAPVRAAPARTAARAQPRASAPASARAARAAPAEPVNPAPVEATAPPSTASTANAAPAPAPIAAPPPVAANPAPVQHARTGSILPWLLAALAAIGAIAFLLTRRRRARMTEDEAEGAPAPVVETVAPGAIPLAASPAAGAARPWIELLMRPVRAGVEDKDAVVQFELTVDNRGSAPAKDVRISTWMVAAGSETEGERALIERPAGTESAPVTIDSGDTKTIERAVALPTAGMEEDSVLPVVMAEARYRLPDGSEGRTSASFEVGVPDGKDFAHFAIDNPSGLHEDVEARMHREPERA
jgi:hypothetical protein